MNFDFFSILTSLFGTLFPFFAQKKEVPEVQKRYEEIQFEVAQALTIYSCYYHNPVDLADYPDGKLPSQYTNASDKLRELGSKMAAFSETLPEKVKDLPITAGQMSNVSRYLIGLSNSMTTPYNQSGRSSGERRAVRGWEKEIRDILNIHEPNRE